MAKILLKCITVSNLCVQLLQFYTDQFGTLQALMSWSVDVHVFWHYRQFNFCHFFSTHFLVLKYYGQCMFQGKHIVGGGFTHFLIYLYFIMVLTEASGYWPWMYELQGEATDP